MTRGSGGVLPFEKKAFRDGSKTALKKTMIVPEKSFQMAGVTFTYLIFAFVLIIYGAQV
jgi:hypothetical protein